MDLRLRALAVLAEDLSLVPSIQVRWLIASYNSNLDSLTGTGEIIRSSALFSIGAYILTVNL